MYVVFFPFPFQASILSFLLFLLLSDVVLMALLCLIFSTVENLAKTGAKMVIISNSSRRSSITMEKVKSLGFDPSLFVGAITSGELTHQYLQRLKQVYLFLIGRKVISIS